MDEKMQESGLMEIIPLIYIFTLWGQYPVFSSLNPLRVRCVGGRGGGWWLDGHNILWQVTFFVHKCHLGIQEKSILNVVFACLTQVWAWD